MLGVQMECSRLRSTKIKILSNIMVLSKELIPRWYISKSCNPVHEICHQMLKNDILGLFPAILSE